MICTAANTLWLAGCLPEAARFRRATSRVCSEQERLLSHLLRANADTELGRRHGFGTIRTVREYQERVPLATYDDYRPAIDRAAEGSSGVLTRERVRLFEPTSGSSGATKLVPYTASLQQEFQRGIRPWIADLFLHRPELANGQAYWSVSPVTATSQRTTGGIPIGFDDDSSYVGGWQQWLVRAVMAAPASLRQAPDIDRFRYLTLLALVRSSGLRLVSVWHPTFLLWLVERLPEWGDALARDLATDRRRAEVLRAALAAGTPAERHAMLWPRLGLISCWTEANAAGPSARISALFPQARLQGKGLIATEAFISLPLVDQPGSALAVRSHFLEFLDPEGATAGRPYLAHELQQGQRYAVVVSTGGGFYRYQLQDVVEVLGHLRECPLIRFAGRQHHVSDWFGEKLNEAHVAGVLRDVLAGAGVSASFAMLACDDSLPRPGYVLYIETPAPDESLASLARDIESSLRESFQYDYACRLGQLAPLRVFRARNAGESYLDAAVRAGQRAGDVKPLALDRRSGWSQILQGRFVPATPTEPHSTA